MLQAWLVRQAVRLQKKALLFTDERSKLEGELLNGIDVVKCNSWEVRASHSIVLVHVHGCVHQAGALVVDTIMLLSCHVASTLPCGMTACCIRLDSGLPKHIVESHLCLGLPVMATAHEPV